MLPLRRKMEKKTTENRSTTKALLLCLDDACEAPYEELPDDWFVTDGQEPLDSSQCNYDYNPNLLSTFIMGKPGEGVNGLNLLFSKEDLFFLAWISIREKINPYFFTDRNQ